MSKKSILMIMQWHLRHTLIWTIFVVDIDLIRLKTVLFLFNEVSFNIRMRKLF